MPLVSASHHNATQTSCQHDGFSSLKPRQYIKATQCLSRVNSNDCTKSTA